MSEHPVAIIGAGPQGLAAAAHLTERGIDAVVLEQGSGPGAAIAEWGHVRLFSAWPELVDAASARVLAPTGWTAPAEGYPTGAEWVRDYLAPLAGALGSRVRTNTTVTAVTRRGRDKVIDADRAGSPLVVHTRDADGTEGRLVARAVIDASGTWSAPGPAGADGVPAVGEAAASDRISYRIPEDVDHFAGSHVAVIGAGHSAAHTVLRLSELARREPGTKVSWLLRRASTANVFGGGAGDGLPERAAIGAKARDAVDAGAVELVTGFRTAAIVDDGETLRLRAEDGRELAGVTHVFVLTGFRPDTSILRELRIDLDTSLEAVAGIADEIDPNIHSCGTVPATGARQLAHPERGVFIVGAKSYGRAPTFLALTGYEQVRSVTAHLAGDHEAASRNELVLPETGVCGGSGSFDGDGGCCAPPALLTIGLGPRRAASARAGAGGMEKMPQHAS